MASTRQRGKALARRNRPQAHQSPSKPKFQKLELDISIFWNFH